MSYTDDNLSFALLFEECFYFAEKLQAIIDKNPSDKLAITKIIEQFKEFLTAQNDLTMKKQSNCQDFEHSKLSSYLEDSRKKFLSLSETLENLKVEKDDIKKALKLEEGSKKQIILYFKRKIEKIIRMFTSEILEEKNEKIDQKLQKLLSSQPWLPEQKNFQFSETSTPYSHYSNVPSFINNSFQSSFEEANIIDSQNEKDSFSLFDALDHKIQNKSLIEKIKTNLNFGNGSVATKEQEKHLLDLFDLKEAIKSQNLPDFCFKNHVRLDELLKKCNKKNNGSNEIKNSDDFNKIMNVSVKKSSLIENGEKNLTKNKKSQKELNFVSGSLLSEIPNFEKKNASNQSLLSLLDNPNNVENNKSPLNNNNEILNSEVKNQSISENKRSNKVELILSEKKPKNNEPKENNTLKNYSPVALLKESNVNKITMNLDVLPSAKKSFQKKEKVPDCPLKFNKLKLVLNKVNFPTKKIINS